jgi:hypothetical protein
MDAEAILRLLQGVDDLNTRPIIRDIQLALIEVKQLKQRVKELEDPIKSDNYMKCESCWFHNIEGSECDIFIRLPEFHRVGFGCIHFKDIK